MRFVEVLYVSNSYRSHTFDELNEEIRRRAVDGQRPLSVQFLGDSWAADEWTASFLVLWEKDDG